MPGAVSLSTRADAAGRAGGELGQAGPARLGDLGETGPGGLTAGSFSCPGTIRAGLRTVLLAHSVMSGSAPNAWVAWLPRTCAHAQSPGVLGRVLGGHNRFFSRSSPRVAST